MSISKAEVDPLASGGLVEQLRRDYHQFTFTQKKIAKYIVEHLQAVAFSTLDRIAAELDTNPSTIVRFTYRLGLAGYPDLQERIRVLVRGQLSRIGSLTNEGQVARRLDGTSFGASLSHDWENLGRTIADIDTDCVEQAVKFVAGARRIYVVAGFSTFPVAHYFALILERLRSGISLLASNDASATARLVNMNHRDCVVAFTFPRYARATHRIALWAKENRAKVVAVTDSPYRRWGSLPMSFCSSPRPEPACRIRWSRRWRGPMRCSPPWLPAKDRDGGSLAAPPLHTTVRTGPYTAVREVALTRLEQGWETERFEVRI